jgi:hypothetical protein
VSTIIITAGLNNPKPLQGLLYIKKKAKTKHLHCHISLTSKRPKKDIDSYTPNNTTTQQTNGRYFLYFNET